MRCQQVEKWDRAGSIGHMCDPQRGVSTMKIRHSRSGKFIMVLDGASRIVAAPNMQKTRKIVAEGSVASDWRAIGNDLRRAIVRKTDVPVG